MNVASQKNDVLTALEKVEDREWKLELEIVILTNEDDKSKKRTIVAKLDQKTWSFMSCCDGIFNFVCSLLFFVLTNKMSLPRTHGECFESRECCESRERFKSRECFLS